MNREEAKVLAPYVEAFSNGEDVQYRLVGCGDKLWQSVGNDWKMNELTMDPDYCEYRIKSEPREFWLCWESDRTDLYRFPIPEYSEDGVKHWDNYIKAVEVLE